MREEAELLRLIQSVGEGVGARAIGLSGSRTDPQAPKDFLQDFDVVYVMDDIQPLVDDPSWLEAFGPLMIRQTPEASTIYPPSLGGCFTYLMHFLDGVRIDLMLCPLALVDRLANEPGLQPLLDPDQLLSFTNQANHSHYWIKRPTQAAFREHCNEFWWVSTYVVKGLLRKQLIYAADHLYTICWQELLWIEDLFVAHTQQFQVSTGKNHKYLQSFLTEKEWRELTSLLDFSTITACGQSLLKMQKRFDGQAKN
nr:aminoglycoside 6-adenylyltransferase [Enterococcus innesii]